VCISSLVYFLQGRKRDRRKTHVRVAWVHSAGLDGTGRTVCRTCYSLSLSHRQVSSSLFPSWYERANLVFVSPTLTRHDVTLGPGNNGGDGLVAARHMAQMGYRPVVHLTRNTSPSTSAYYVSLVNLAQTFGVEMIPSAVRFDLDASANVSMIIDAVFGRAKDLPASFLMRYRIRIPRPPKVSL
jgi:hypothetical protein